VGGIETGKMGPVVEEIYLCRRPDGHPGLRRVEPCQRPDLGQTLRDVVPEFLGFPGPRKNDTYPGDGYRFLAAPVTRRTRIKLVQHRLMLSPRKNADKDP
jgi:hypothetical protein